MVLGIEDLVDTFAAKLGSPALPARWLAPEVRLSLGFEYIEGIQAR